MASLQPLDAPLTRSDLHACLELLHGIGEASADGEGFARRGLSALTRLVASELTTLSICDLGAGHRSIVADAPGAISKQEIEAFDRHFHEHPLVREHGRNPRAVTQRISDVVPPARFRRSALFNEYYRPIGIDHTMAVPIHVDDALLVAFVFNRSGLDFSARDRACAEAVRPHLGHLFRLSRALDRARASQWAPSPAPATPGNPPLTAREHEVLKWLTGGKTDRDIADILGISRRTVHKHLQRIYEKLGVETRTAAVVRAMGLASHRVASGRATQNGETAAITYTIETSRPAR